MFFNTVPDQCSMSNVHPLPGRTLEYNIFIVFLAYLLHLKEMSVSESL